MYTGAYIRTWPLDTEEKRYWSADMIHGEKLSELIVSFALIRDGIVYISGADKSDLKIQLQTLHEQYPNLKLTVSIGGADEHGFSDVVRTMERRNRFISAIISVMQKYGFTGADIDWEFPQTSADRTCFVLLLSDLRTAFNDLEKTTGVYYTLSTALPSDKNFIQKNDVVSIARICDRLNIMCYDYAGSWTALTGHLGNLSPDPENPDQPSTKQGIQAYLDAGVSPEKIVLGIPFYGRRWDGVSDNGCHGLYQPYRKCTGSLSRPDLKKIIAGESGFVRYWDTAAEAPWLYNGDTFISYCDSEEIECIVSYVIQKRLQGVMYWEYGCDPDGSLLDELYQTIRDNISQ